jgi:hypothetical protein
MTLGFQPRHRLGVRLTNTIKVYQSITKHAMNKNSPKVANRLLHDITVLVVQTEKSIQQRAREFKC